MAGSPSRPLHLLLLALLLIALTAGSVLAVAAIRTRSEVRQMDDHLARVERGMTRAEARALMGGPGVPYAGPFNGWRDSDPLPPEEAALITSAERYQPNTYVPLMFYEITYDSTGRVVGRRRYD